MTTLADLRILVTGGAGFLGSAVVRALRAQGAIAHLIRVPRSRDFDLTDRSRTRQLITQAFRDGPRFVPPDLVIHCAAAVGGIQANRDQPARFFHDNMAMSLHVVDECARAWRAAGMIDRAAVVQVGSMTSYPADATIPYTESSLFQGQPPADTAPYGLAKLAALTLLQAYAKQHGLKSAYVIPVNLYGPGDNIADVKNAHVCGSLIKRFVDAVRERSPSLTNWGTGAPTREFLYIDDAAEGIVAAAQWALKNPAGPVPINLGSGREISIKDLASTIARLTGYTGKVEWDASKPDGQARRSLDVSRARELLGWSAKTDLDAGLRATIEWYTSTLAASPER